MVIQGVERGDALNNAFRSGNFLCFFFVLILLIFFFRVMVPIFMRRKLPAPQALGNPPLFAASETHSPGRKGVPLISAFGHAGPAVLCRRMPTTLRTINLHFSHNYHCLKLPTEFGTIKGLYQRQSRLTILDDSVSNLYYITGGAVSVRLRGDLASRPLEPDPDHAGVGKLILS